MVTKVWPKAVVAVLILAFIINVLPVEADGVGVGMDTSVTDSQASFIGEDLLDYAGQAVAGVGDINGDGFDDFLVGAYNHGDGTQRHGEVYLFYGNATGWKMDMSVTDADASFVGNPGSGAGISLADAGDVNGDGYSDFLIGARGAAHLFLGKASGWSMDTSVWEADATFFGEDPNDYAGYVVGVGDVNRDGLDDFMIGARDNDEWGRAAGQVYLILGKRYGWSNNTSLSNADASYYSGGVQDHLHMAAGAGDVNGDGYDDFLIANPQRISIPHDVGRTYLIFGRSSGWSMDVNLSSVDTSFIGSNISWGIGTSIDGAGDVNADGYDDILISRTGTVGDRRRVGQTFLILGKATGWTKDMNISQAGPYFVGEEESDESGSKVAGVGDFNGDGFDDFLISARSSQEAGYYRGQVYLIYGRAKGWPTETNLSKANASFLGEGDSDNLGWAIDGAGDVNGDELDDIVLGCGQNDEGGKDVGQSYLIFQTDGVPPKIETDRTPDVATTGDNLTFNLSVSDPLAVVDVTIDLWYGDSPVRDKVKCILESGTKRNGTWVRQVTVRSDTIDTLHYFVRVMDSDGINIRSPVKNVTIRDDDYPVILADLSPIEATTGDEFIFRAEMDDNVGIASALVHYRIGSTADFEDVYMSLLSGKRFFAIITVPVNAQDPLEYFFEAVDLSGNTNSSSHREVPVRDNDKPIMERDLTADIATTGEELLFRFEAMDYVGIESAVVSYRYGNDEVSNVTLQGTDGRWTGTIVVDHTLDDLRYTVLFRDTAGNVLTTPEEVIDIVDNDFPSILDSNITERATTGDPFEVILKVSDNIGIESVKVEYIMGTGDPIALMMQLEGTEARVVIDIPSDATGRFSFNITVEDWYGNRLVEPDRNLDIIDDDAPVVIHDTGSGEAIKGLPLSLEYEVSDNIGIGELDLLYRFGDGLANELPLVPSSGSVEVQIPRHPEGALRYSFEATDVSGNTVATDEIQVELVNVVPAVGELPKMNVIEDEEDELDLVHYISDANDVNFTIECTDDAVTVEGTVIRILHTAVVPDRTVSLAVSDGEDVVTANLTVHVISKNDPPIIRSISPANGTSFKEGKKVSLTVETFDEEGDDLTVTWRDEKGVLGAGSPLEVKLKPGKHVITVVVDDGTDQVEESLTVVVKKKEASPGLGPVVALAALVLTGLAARRRR